MQMKCVLFALEAKQRKFSFCCPVCLLFIPISSCDVWFTFICLFVLMLYVLINNFSNVGTISCLPRLNHY